jgi:hypothetical protein
LVEKIFESGLAADEVGRQVGAFSQPNRATGLAEFSKIGRLFGQVFFNYIGCHNWWSYFFPKAKLSYHFWQKAGWAQFWATFSQTHLVTLQPDFSTRYKAELTTFSLPGVDIRIWESV